MAAAGAGAVIANAIRASGVVVRIQPEDFVKIVGKVDKPLVVSSEGGIFSRKYQYLTSYKGFAFFTKSSQPIQFSSGVEIVMARKIWIPG